MSPSTLEPEAGKEPVSTERILGFEKDLHLQGQQYATVLSIVYVGYIVMQLPVNLFLHWPERPAILIPSSMAIWGIEIYVHHDTS
ncbi:hypothetical protein DFH29DRAFT_999882 [Suillus ampliporus]|nr:hypothetical protein DFH29DRAFT_999882 [Suillus ampliporus]